MKRLKILEFLNGKPFDHRCTLGEIRSGAGLSLMSRLTLPVTMFFMEEDDMVRSWPIGSRRRRVYFITEYGREYLAANGGGGR